jgi:hypothetical protein
MMDLEREQLRKTYEVCRMGFGILACALALACVDSLLPLLMHFSPWLCNQIVSIPGYRWIDVPITWGSLLGVIMLWGRFDHRGWQRRVGLLLVMSLVDAVLWSLHYGEALGIAEANFGHVWLLGHVGEALGWAEFALLAGLSCDYLEHLGQEYARESGKATRSMAVTGAVLWLLMFCARTDWRAGWPLIPRQFRALEEYLLYQASRLIWAITLLQVTALVIAAARQSSRVLTEMQQEEESGDPFATQAHRPGEKDLYRT